MTADIRLSSNFTLSELIFSTEAMRLGINNYPKDTVVIENLKRVSQEILQKARDFYRIPFSPNSGYRCPELNKKVGGAKNSQHMKGEAVDFNIPTIDTYALAVWIRDKSSIDYDQLILESYTAGIRRSGWVHCSIVAAGMNRKDVLTKFAGDKKYYPGLLLNKGEYNGR